MVMAQGVLRRRREVRAITTTTPTATAVNTAVAPSALGTVVVETSEDTFQVQEKGLAEGEKSAYLVGKKDGKLYVVDRKRGGSFPESSVKIGYKGWFDKVTAPAEE